MNILDSFKNGSLIKVSSYVALRTLSKKYCFNNMGAIAILLDCITTDGITTKYMILANCEIYEFMIANSVVHEYITIVGHV